MLLIIIQIESVALMMRCTQIVVNATKSLAGTGMNKPIFLNPLLQRNDYTN